MNTGKTIALTRRNFVGKVMSPPFNMLSRLVIAFLPRSKHLLFDAFYWDGIDFIDQFGENLYFKRVESSDVSP